MRHLLETGCHGRAPDIIKPELVGLVLENFYSAHGVAPNAGAPVYMWKKRKTFLHAIAIVLALGIPFPGDPIA